MGDIKARIQALSEAISSYHASEKAGLVDTDKRSGQVAVIREARKLSRLVEDPPNTIFNIVTGPHKMTALRLAVEMNVFENLPVSGSVTLEQLAEKCKVDADFFEHDDIAFGLTRSIPFFRELKFRNPTDSRHTVFNHAFESGRDLDYFEWLKFHPDRSAIFTSSVSSLGRYGLAADSEILKLSEHLDLDRDEKGQFANVDDSEVVLVDVGGGNGHVLKTMLVSNPRLRGRFVLQDLASVLPSKEELNDYPNIEPMAQDFFTPQPDLGARAYHMRMVLHDWPDPQALQILFHIRHALQMSGSRGKSKFTPKLLIQDNILPDRASDTNIALACIDIGTLFLSGKERTETMWRKLLKDAGFKITVLEAAGVEKDEGSGESLRTSGLIIAEVDDGTLGHIETTPPPT